VLSFVFLERLTWTSKQTCQDSAERSLQNLRGERLADPAAELRNASRKAVSSALDSRRRNSQGHASSNPRLVSGESFVSGVRQHEEAPSGGG